MSMLHGRVTPPRAPRDQENVMQAQQQQNQIPHSQQPLLRAKRETEGSRESKAIIRSDEEDLWLGVCVYTGGEPEGVGLCECTKFDWRVVGYSSGIVRVFRNNELLYVLLGHGGTKVIGVWIILVEENLVLVSLDKLGNTCFWGLDVGTCIDKYIFVPNVVNACLAEGRFLCILGEMPASIFVVDLRLRKISYEIGGFCFSKMELLRVPVRSGSLVKPHTLDPKAAQMDPSQTFLVTETVDEDTLFFDFTLRKFVVPSFQLFVMESLELSCILDSERHEVLASYRSEKLTHFESDGDLACDLSEEPHQDALDFPTVIDENPSDRFIVEEIPALFQLGISGIFFILNSDNTLTTQRAHELSLAASGTAHSPYGKAKLSSPVKRSNAMSVSTTDHCICVARPFSSKLLVYSLDLHTMAATQQCEVVVDLPHIDIISISPYADDRICLIDDTLTHTLIVLEGFEQVNKLYFGCSNIHLSVADDVQWSSPFSIRIGKWTFDLLSERFLPRRLHTKYIESESYATPVDRLRAHSSSSTLSHLSMGSDPEFFWSERTRGHNGIHYFEAFEGIKGWSLQVSKVDSWSESLLSLLSFFMVWNVDNDLDKEISEVLKVQKPLNSRYRFVVDRKPRAKMVSLLANASDRWTASSRFTALQTLGLISLFIGLIATDTLEEHQQAVMSSLVSHYGIVFPEHLVQVAQYAFPCFEVLTRFILSETASEDIQIASRLLLQVSIERMPHPVRISRAAEWAGRLHISEGRDKAAVVILGMLGCVNPQDLAPATARLVAQCLRRFIPSRNEEAVIAAELLARGFYIFAPYLEDDLPLLIRDLIVELPGQEERSNLASASQRALQEIGTAKPQLFIHTIGRESLRPGMHRSALLALNNFIKKRPIALLRYLPAVVEIVIKTLDPSESEIRKSCLKFSTVVLHQIVKRFPMASFHQETQRFAVGTVDSIILIYDLRTATKWRILEGHKGPVSALVFEPTRGDELVSYSAEESTLRLWQTGSSSGFFGLLGIQGSCLKTIPLPQLAANRRPQPAEVLQNCALEWHQLIREDGNPLPLGPLLSRR